MQKTEESRCKSRQKRNTGGRGGNAENKQNLERGENKGKKRDSEERKVKTES